MVPFRIENLWGPRLLIEILVPFGGSFLKFFDEQPTGLFHVCVPCHGLPTTIRYPAETEIGCNFVHSWWECATSSLKP